MENEHIAHRDHCTPRLGNRRTLLPSKYEQADRRTARNVYHVPWSYRGDVLGEEPCYWA
jgi:hypothetical protein